VQMSEPNTSEPLPVQTIVRACTTRSAVLTFVVNLYSPCQSSIHFEYTKTHPKRELFRFIRHVRWVTDYKD
jgi:hypothetical protein